MPSNTSSSPCPSTHARQPLCGENCSSGASRSAATPWSHCDTAFDDTIPRLLHPSGHVADGAPWLRSSSAAGVGGRKPLCVPLIDCGGDFEPTVEIKCLIAVRSGSSSQSQEQQGVAALVCLGAAGVNRAARGCGGPACCGVRGRQFCGGGSFPGQCWSSPASHPPRRNSHRASGFRMKQLKGNCGDLMAKLKRSKKVIICRWGLRHREIDAKSLLSLQVPCWNRCFPTPTTTRSIPYSQAQFLLPSIVGMGGVHAHRSVSRLVTQKMRNVSPRMIFQWFVFTASPGAARRRQGLQAAGAAGSGGCCHPPRIEQVLCVQRGKDQAGKLTCHHLIKDSSERRRCLELIKPAASLQQPWPSSALIPKL